MIRDLLRLIRHDAAVLGKFTTVVKVERNQAIYEMNVGEGGKRVEIRLKSWTRAMWSGDQEIPLTNWEMIQATRCVKVTHRRLWKKIRINYSDRLDGVFSALRQL